MVFCFLRSSVSGRYAPLWAAQQIFPPRILMPPILTCSGISKTFERAAVPVTFLQDHLLSRSQRKQRIQALKDISFDLQQGEWVGLFGPNGCGKTTLLRILAGVMQPDNGSVTINGGVSSYFDFLAGFHEERNAIENLYFHGLFQ